MYKAHASDMPMAGCRLERRVAQRAGVHQGREAFIRICSLKRIKWYMARSSGIVVALCSFNARWERPGQPKSGRMAALQPAVGWSREAAHLNPLTEMNRIG